VNQVEDGPSRNISPKMAEHKFEQLGINIERVGSPNFA
jgi:hypothetical protein